MDFINNPFFLIKASTKDNRKKLIELADEAVFEIDSIRANEARSILSNPRKRLEAELSWMPGCNSEVIKEILKIVKNKHKLQEIKNKWDLNPISFSNLIANLISSKNIELDNIYLIRVLIHSYEEIEASSIQSLINKDREDSGFPTIDNISDIEDNLKYKRRYYLTRIKEYTDTINDIDIFSNLLISFLDEVDNNEKLEPLLLSDLVDLYEIQFKQLVIDEEEKVLSKIKKIREYISKDYKLTVLRNYVRDLNKEVRNWDSLVQPIQLSTRNRGLDHIQSRDFAIKIRSLAIDLNNDCQETDLAKSITENLKEVFAEVGQILDLTTKDSKALEALKGPSSGVAEIYKNCEKAMESVKSNPSGAQYLAEDLRAKCDPILKTIEDQDTEENFITASDYVALTLNLLAVAVGNERKEFGTSIDLLESGLVYAKNKETKTKLLTNKSTFEKNVESRNEANTGCLLKWGFYLFIVFAINFCAEQSNNNKRRRQYRYNSYIQKIDKNITTTHKFIEPLDISKINFNPSLYG